MENISKCTQIQPKRAIMAYGLPMQLSGAVGPTNTIKSHLGSDFFWCWSHVVFANTADSGIAPRKWPGLKKGILPVLGRKEPICWSRLDLSASTPITSTSAPHHQPALTAPILGVVPKNRSFHFPTSNSCMTFTTLGSCAIPPPQSSTQPKLRMSSTPRLELSSTPANFHRQSDLR